MWNMEKVTLVTNNDRVYEKYREDMEVLLLDSYRGRSFESPGSGL